MFARDAELRRVVDLAARGRSVRLVGARWSGRSALLRAVVPALEEVGRAVHVVTGSRGVPDLEAVRVSLPPRARAALGGRPLQFSSVYDVLSAYLADGERVLVVDDADLLDDQSRGVLGLVHQQHGTPVVAAVRPGADGAHGRAPWPADADLPVVQVRLGGLGPDDLHSLLVARAGGPVSPQVSARIHGDCAGLPGLALVTLDGALAHGALRQVDGVWVGEDLWTPDLGAVHAGFLAGYPRALQDAVDVLGLAGAVDVGLAAQVVDAEVLDALEAAELVRVVPAGECHLVVLNPPGLADSVERGTLTARRRRLLSDAIRRVSVDAPVLDEDAARLVGRLRERLLHQATPAPTRIDLAHRDESVGGVLAQHHRLEVQAAVRTWEARRSVPAAVALLRLLLSGSTDRELVPAVLRQTGAAGASDADAAVELAWYRARWRLTAGDDPADVAADLAATPTDGRAGACAALARVLRAEHAVPDPDPGEDERLRALVDTDAPGSPVVRVALAGCRVVAGATAGALDLLAVDRTGWPAYLADSADLLHGLALHGSGRFAEGLVHGRDVARRARARLDGAAYAAGRYVTALCLTARLDLAEARHELFPLLSSGAQAGTLVLPPCRAVRVLLASLSLYQGRDALAAGLLDLAGDTAGCGRALPYADPVWLAAAERYASGDLDGAAGMLDAAADDLRAAALAYAADVTTMTRLVVRYDPDRARRLESTTDRVGGPLQRAFLAAKRAMHEQDAHALVRVAQQLVDLGVPAQAARCALTAAGMHQRAGDLAAAARARGLAAGLRVVRAPVVDTPEPGTVLTGREREIAELVARGASNTVIAERLFLSRRTVESHLRNIRRKTGAGDRESVGRLAAGG